MRARNIKPGLFKNEHLGTSDPINTVIFEGLWCLADREGRLEDRPLRIHAEINPYRPSASTVLALTWLHNHAFIVRYKASGVEYIAIPRFKEHQQPHIKEAASKIPEPTESMLCDNTSASTVLAPCENGERTVRAALIPDSGFPLPDSPSLIPDVRKHQTHAPRAQSQFDEVRKEYPRRGGGQRWADGERGYLKSLANGATHEEVLQGVRRYAAFVRTKGEEGGEYVQQAGTFFGRNEGWREQWIPPTVKRELSPIERVQLANGLTTEKRDERVVSEQRGGEDLGDIFGDVWSKANTGLRRIGS